MIKVIQFSDIHLFGDEAGRLLGVNTEESFAKVLEAAQKGRHWPPDFILATGDLSHDGSEASYRKLRRVFEDLSRPVHCLPGNHDQKETMARGFSGKPVAVSREFEVGGWLLVLLDSTIPKETGGHLSESELKRLDAVLKKHPHHHVLISFHHHPVKVGSVWLD